MYCVFFLELFLIFTISRRNVKKNRYECNVQYIEDSISDAKKSENSMFSWSDFFVNALALELAALLRRAALGLIRIIV